MTDMSTSEDTSKIRMAAHDPDSLSELASKWLQDGLPERAAEAYALLVDMHPTVDRFQFRYGLALEALGDVDGALERFQKSIDISPEFGVFHHQYMRSLVRHRGHDAALRAYTDGQPGLSKLPTDLKMFFSYLLLEAGADTSTVHISCVPSVWGRLRRRERRSFSAIRLCPHYEEIGSLLTGSSSPGS